MNRLTFQSLAPRVASTLRDAWAQDGRRWIWTIWFIAIAVILMLAQSSPAEPPIAELLRAIKSGGVVIIFLGTIANQLQAVVVGRQRRPSELLASVAHSISGNCAWYALTLWCVGNYGDEIYRSVVANPLNAGVNLAAILLLWPLLQRAVLRPLSRRWEDDVDGVAATVAATLPSSTARDLDYAAAHEAGHIMVHAAIDELPAGLVVQLHRAARWDGSLGFAGGWQSDHKLPVVSFVEWRLVVDLAGQVAEKHLLGEATLGARQDHEVWLERARGYLSLQTRGRFYPEPRNAFEQARNDEALDALQAEHLEHLTRLFERNSSLLRQIAQDLGERGRLDLDDLRPLLARVELPDGFPRVSSSNFRLPERGQFPRAAYEQLLDRNL